MIDLDWNKHVYVIDIETDGLLPNSTPDPKDWLTEIYVVSVLKVNKKGNPKVISLTDYDEMRSFFDMEDAIYVGHNLSLYDIPAIKYILEITPKGKVIDTLSLSWYLECRRVKHSLETYAIEQGNNKVIVENWKQGEEGADLYRMRCERDVQINHLLWEKQKDQLLEIYETQENAWNLINYLQDKLRIIEQQLRVGIPFDIHLCNKALEELNAELGGKIEALTSAMPKCDIVKKKNKPKNMFLKDGVTFSKPWTEWLKFKEEYGVTEEYDDLDSIEYISGDKPGNPGSVSQIKDWLFSLGWEPSTFAFNRDKETNEVKQVPQVQDKETGEVCKCVKLLFDKEPALKYLNSVGVIRHRIGLLKGFLKEAVLQPDGTYRLYAGVNKWTNTLRLSHKTIVNLPGVKKAYAKNIRACLMAGEGHTWVSADISGLEDATKLSEIYNFDPDYVNEILNNPDWDPHLNIGMLSGKISKEDVDWYIEINKRIEKDKYIPTPEEKERVGKIKDTRSKSKVVNFSAVYSVGAKTLARNSGMPVSEAQKLLDVYWKRNWSVKELANSYKIKQTSDGQIWLYGTRSKIWYSLRNDKDRFSTGNQSLGDYVFSRWLLNVEKLKHYPVLQMHDEWNGVVPDDQVEEVVAALQTAMDMTNKEIGLNVTIKISIQTGGRYSNCH
jgi:hypothetical protein